MNTQEREEERKRAEQAELASKYRAIGPAAIVAALLSAHREAKAKAPTPQVA